MRMVVYCPNMIGDTVMATPTLRALRQGFPNARIVGLLRPNSAPTLDGAPWLDDRILFHHQAKEPEHRAPAVLRRLQAERFDLALILPNSFRSAWLIWRAGIPRRVGYARGGRRLLLTDRLKPLRDRRGRFVPVPAVEYYLALARHLGCPIASVRTELRTTDAEEQASVAAWRRLGLSSRETVVCLNTGGAFGPAKNWPVEHFATLARRLADEAGVAVLVVCGPAERENARRIVTLADHPSVVSLAEEPLSLGLTKASIKHSALLVTTDSGPRHFAGAFGVPVLTLFGPTHMAWTRTYHPHSVHLQVPVPCGPCQQPRCPLGHHRCMNDLDPNLVFQAALRWLKPRSNHLPLVLGPNTPSKPQIVG